jgi:hypothetical protein
MACLRGHSCSIRRRMIPTTQSSSSPVSCLSSRHSPSYRRCSVTQKTTDFFPTTTTEEPSPAGRPTWIHSDVHLTRETMCRSSACRKLCLCQFPCFNGGSSTCVGSYVKLVTHSRSRTRPPTTSPSCTCQSQVLIMPKTSTQRGS